MPNEPAFGRPTSRCRKRCPDSGRPSVPSARSALAFRTRTRRASSARRTTRCSGALTAPRSSSRCSAAARRWRRSAAPKTRCGPRARLESTEQSVLLNAATAYSDVYRDQAVLELNIRNEQRLARQLEATRDRFQVGEVTRTDVSQAEARLARATAERLG